MTCTSYRSLLRLNLYMFQENVYRLENFLINCAIFFSPNRPCDQYNKWVQLFPCLPYECSSWLLPPFLWVVGLLTFDGYLHVHFRNYGTTKEGSLYSIFLWGKQILKGVNRDLFLSTRSRVFFHKNMPSMLQTRPVQKLLQMIFMAAHPMKRCCAISYITVHQSLIMRETSISNRFHKNTSWPNTFLQLQHICSFP
jgi:hypothetical protein